ncbi:hypothetical protein NDU88_007019 [Pleurodeles waltl]|uniref:Uncharacterized protein n=1 Tax=Pleurodeles waltl TaxID=8319 RepID=A0AAV7VQX0_PLEWA|nr:hypothetical protein NDU88_007019 [Pleurodeles waltl]
MWQGDLQDNSGGRVDRSPRVLDGQPGSSRVDRGLLLCNVVHECSLGQPLWGGMYGEGSGALQGGLVSRIGLFAAQHETSASRGGAHDTGHEWGKQLSQAAVPQASAQRSPRQPKST